MKYEIVTHTLVGERLTQDTLIIEQSLIEQSLIEQSLIEQSLIEQSHVYSFIPFGLWENPKHFQFAILLGFSPVSPESLTFVTSFLDRIDPHLLGNLFEDYHPRPEI